MSSGAGRDRVPEVRLWKIFGEGLVEIEKPQLDFEERLENWMESDISIIDPGLLVIARQLETDYGGVIDLLCIDEKGDLVIIELKRDKTPREITAQVLDYASWVKHLTPDRVQSIAESYLEESFDDVFSNKYNQELPESINEEHRILVIGSRIDSSSRRIINYLSETYGVSINAATFNYFKEDGNELLARTFLIEQERAERGTRSGSKRRPNLTFEQLQGLADENGVGDIYSYLFEYLQPFFSRVGRTRSSISFKGTFRDTKNASIFNLIPGESSERGLQFQVYSLRFRELFDVPEEQLLDMLPEDVESWMYGTPGDQKRYLENDIDEQWSGYTGQINLEEAEKLVRELGKIHG